MTGVTPASSRVSSCNRRCLALADELFVQPLAVHLIQLLPRRLLCNMVALVATRLASRYQRHCVFILCIQTRLVFYLVFFGCKLRRVEGEEKSRMRPPVQ